MIVNYEYTQDLRTRRGFNIFTEDNVFIGSAEGSGNVHGEFMSVIRVDPNFNGQGIGFNAFKHVLELIHASYPVTTIIGAWHKNDEYKDLPEGMSTNLLFFRNNLKTLSPADSALSTPTGKWASKLGFVNCTVVSQSVDEVIVHFTK